MEYYEMERVKVKINSLSKIEALIIIIVYERDIKMTMKAMLFSQN